MLRAGTPEPDKGRTHKCYAAAMKIRRMCELQDMWGRMNVQPSMIRRNSWAKQSMLGTRLALPGG